MSRSMRLFVVALFTGWKTIDYTSEVLDLDDRSATHAHDASTTSDVCEPLSDSPPPLQFVHIAKTGGSFLETLASQHNISWGACLYLNRLGGGSKWARCPPYLDKERKNRTRYGYNLSPWHIPPVTLREQTAQDDFFPYFNGSTLFMVVRNPYERVLSSFKHWQRHRKKQTGVQLVEILNTFMKTKLQHMPDEGLYKLDGHLVPQYLYTQPVYPDQPVEILRLESLADDFGCLVQKYRLPRSMDFRGGNHSAVNASPSEVTISNLTDESIALIERVYQQDFQSFGYPLLSENRAAYDTIITEN